jgi:hypothetical protein
MNDLERFFRKNDENQGPLITKWQHYFEIYDRHFSRFRGKKIHLLEIGVAHGGSLKMWRDYFGPEAHIFGVDINPACKKFEAPGIDIFIGSQDDPEFLKSLKSKLPPLDILIDDGGHTMHQQKLTFETLFDHVKADGVYLAEDLHTSYWPTYGGGHRRSSSFIEFSKNWIDGLNSWHSIQPSLVVDSFAKSSYSVHYYDSVVAIEKRPISKPFVLKSGVPALTEFPVVRTTWRKKFEIYKCALGKRLGLFTEVK